MTTLKEKLKKAGGVGPMLVFINLPYIILTLVFMHKNPEVLNLAVLDSPVFRWLSAGWLLFGVGFWISAVVVFTRNFERGILLTKGPFGWCRNPIYASFIVFIIPAFAVYFHAGMLILVDLVFYVMFKVAIHGETRVLEREYGDAYCRYRKTVNEILPFPPRKH